MVYGLWTIWEHNIKLILVDAHHNLLYAVCEIEPKWSSCSDTLSRNLQRMLKANEPSSMSLLLEKCFLVLRCFLGELLFLVSDKVLLFSRFPFIACEIFTCEIDVILKTLVEEEEVGFIFIITLCFNQEVGLVNALLLMVIFTFMLFQLMNLLFSFLEPNRSHSALLAGYFSKVCF
jgi:hypothetical protein